MIFLASFSVFGIVGSNFVWFRVLAGVSLARFSGDSSLRMTAGVGLGVGWYTTYSSGWYEPFAFLVGRCAFIDLPTAFMDTIGCDIMSVVSQSLSL